MHLSILLVTLIGGVICNPKIPETQEQDIEVYGPQSLERDPRLLFVVPLTGQLVTSLLQTLGGGGGGSGNGTAGNGTTGGTTGGGIFQKKQRPCNGYIVSGFKKGGGGLNSTAVQGVCQNYFSCVIKRGKIVGICGLGTKSCCYHQTTTTTTTTTTPKPEVQYMSVYQSGVMQPEYEKITIDPVTPTVCQLRVDFLNLNLPPPDADGNCVNGNITFTMQANDVPQICGNGDDQHIYLDFDSAKTPIMAVINTNNVPPSNYQIKVTQIECDDTANLAPTVAGVTCLQYYQARTGRVSSFNYAGGQHLANQQYNVCLPSTCAKVQWSEDPAEVDISNEVTTNFGPCSTDFLIIPNYETTLTGGVVFQPNDMRVCGPRNAPQYPGMVFTGINMPPAMTVVFDGNENPENAVTPPVGNRGFDMTYTCV